MKTTKQDKVRLNLLISAADRERLQRLRGDATMTATIARAVALLEWLEERRAAGDAVLVREAGGAVAEVKFLS